MIAAGPPPTVGLGEAAASAAARAERDRQVAAWCGLEGADADAYIERVGLFDLNTRRLHREAVAGSAEVDDSRDGMIARLDGVIADLLDQLFPVAPRG